MKTTKKTFRKIKKTKGEPIEKQPLAPISSWTSRKLYLVFGVAIGLIAGLTAVRMGWGNTGGVNNSGGLKVKTADNLPVNNPNVVGATQLGSSNLLKPQGSSFNPNGKMPKSVEDIVGNSNIQVK